MFVKINFLLIFNEFILVLQNNSSYSTIIRVKFENAYARWFLTGAFVEKNTFKVFNISFGVVCCLTARPRKPHSIKNNKQN